ncbi:unnamed protein product [Candidula unifasciata]|uniref:Serine protease n=1 Tax=Candidula unifasciata TaxID=100452 RepID=A0A8S3ZW59_9EUPU|nr:unnamed protein product [Candidula unifasciata]
MATVADGLRKDACRLAGKLQEPTFKKTETENGSKLETNGDELTVVVSHPHGCSKQISLGFCSYIDVMKDEWTRYTYTTATCPGSSGAPVVTISKNWSYYVHSGGNSTKDGQLNYSSHGINILPQDLESRQKLKDLNTTCDEANRMQQ